MTVKQTSADGQTEGQTDSGTNREKTTQTAKSRQTDRQRESLQSLKSDSVRNEILFRVEEEREEKEKEVEEKVVLMSEMEIMRSRE